MLKQERSCHHCPDLYYQQNCKNNHTNTHGRRSDSLTPQRYNNQRLVTQFNYKNKYANTQRTRSDSLINTREQASKHTRDKIFSWRVEASEEEPIWKTIVSDRLMTKWTRVTSVVISLCTRLWKNKWSHPLHLIPVSIARTDKIFK